MMGWLVHFVTKILTRRDITVWGVWVKDTNNRCTPHFETLCTVLLPELVPAPSWNPTTSSPPPLISAVCPTSPGRLGAASPSSPWIALSPPHSKVLPCGLLLLVRLPLLTDMPI